MRVMVTGANGHLGSNTIRALLRKGYDVVPFVRPSADLRSLAGLELTYAYGDVLDGKSVVEAAAGCDAIIHSAGIFNYWGRRPDELIQTAEEGVANVMEAAKAHGTGRVVYTSSLYAMGLVSRPDQRLTEDDWNEDAHTGYALSKTRGERAAWRMAERYGVPVIALCPGGILGRLDYRLTPSNSWIRGMVNERIPVFNIGGNFVDVRDVAQAHVAAVEHGEPGRRYIISGSNLLMKDMARIVTGLTGARLFYLPLPRPAVLAFATVLEAVARLTGLAPLTTRAFVREAYGRYQFADGAAAEQAFGLRPRPAEEMIADTIRWLLHTKQIRTGKARELAARFLPDPTWE